MSNNYVFLEKAKGEPDLQDVVEYLKKPLHLLQDLEHTLKRVSSEKQLSIENHKIKLKLENITNHYLPGLIDEYCKFSFSHRNTAVIKTIYGKDYTAKELLLKNIAKITEESILLHDDFYENNKFKFLVHDKIASDLGFAKFGNTQPAIALQNKFDYSTYSENGDIFKKEEVSCAEGACSIDEAAENHSVNHSQASGGGLFIEIIMVISISIILLIGSMYMYAKKVEEQSLEHMQQQFKSIQAAVDLYIAQNDLTTPFNNQTLAEENYLPKDQLFYHAWGNLRLRNINEQHYAIDLYDIPKNACNTLSNPNFTSSSKVIVNHDGAQCGDKNYLQFIQNKKTVSDKEITEAVSPNMTVTYNNIPQKECELLQKRLSVKENHCKTNNSITYALKD